MAPCLVGDLAVGHSAHVSRPGYLPAAPFRRRGARTELVLLVLSPAQLAALDATEPSYRRQWLDAGRYPIWAGLQRPAGCWVYVSRYDVLADAARQPVPLTTQRAVHKQLRELPEIAALLGDVGPDDAVRTLAGAADLVRGALQRHSRVAPANL